MLNPMEWRELKHWFDKKASKSDLTASELQQLMDWLINRSTKHDRSTDYPDNDTADDDNLEQSLKSWIEKKSKESDLTARELEELTTWILGRSADNDTTVPGDRRGLKVWLEEKFKESDLTASELQELAKWLFSRSREKPGKKG